MALCATLLLVALCSVPPRLYGGTERVVSYLTEELVRLGHDVTLFASGDSVTSAKEQDAKLVDEKLLEGRDHSEHRDADPDDSSDCL
jgi:hypothetical protein